MPPSSNLKGVIKLGPGTRVKVHSLKNATEHNGAIGKLLQFDQVKMRWGVELEDGGKQLSLKISNILPVDMNVTPAVSREAGGPLPADEPIPCPTKAADTQCQDEPSEIPAPTPDVPASASVPLEEKSSTEKPAPGSTLSAADAAALGVPGAAEAAAKTSATTEKAPQISSEAPADLVPGDKEDDQWPVLPTSEETSKKMQSGCWFENESAAKRFAEQLRANDPKLTSVVLVPPKRFNDEDVQEICEALDGNTCCRELLASGHHLSEDSCKLLSGMLKGIAALETLSVGDSALGDQATLIFEGLAQNKSITSLDLEQKGLTVEACKALAAALAQREEAGAASIAKLLLSRNAKGVGPALDTFEAATKTVPKQLMLCDCGLGSEHIKGLGKWIMRGVQDLDLRNNAALGGDGAEQLFACLHASSAVKPLLRRLRLDGCHIGDDGVEALAEAMIHGLPIQELFLEHCEITAEGCAHLASAVRRRSGGRMLQLSLRANTFGDEGTVHAAICAEKLDLSSASLTSQSLAVLSEQPLISLELFSNPTLGPSFPAWLASLNSTVWQHMENLDLSGCALGDDGFDAVCNALAQRHDLLPALNHLALGANDVELNEERSELVERLGTTRKGHLKVVWQDGA